jgi:drug/metabolite transporter (DMT)-like permease
MMVAFAPLSAACNTVPTPRSNVVWGMTSSRRSYHIGLLLVTAAAVAWSTSGLFTRLLAADTPTILFWRGFFGALGMCLVIAILPGAGGFRSFRRLGWPGFAYAGLTALSMLLFISALRNTTVAHVAVITAIVPFVAAYLGWAVMRDVPQPSAIMASTVALIGVAIMAGISADGSKFGDALAGAMALCMAGMILLSRRFGNIPALPATCLASALSAAATLPFVTFVNVTPEDLAVLALFGLVNQVLGFGLFALGARLLPPMETALITALDAPLAPLWVWLFLAETPGNATLLVGAAVLAAVIGHIRWANRRSQVTSSTPG